MRNVDYEAYEAHLANDRALYAYAETLFTCALGDIGRCREMWGRCREM